MILKNFRICLIITILKIIFDFKILETYILAIKDFKNYVSNIEFKNSVLVDDFENSY